MTSTLYAGTRTPVLLQTALLQLFKPHCKESRTVARTILDGESQRMYITNRLRDELSLPTMRMEVLQIKIFGGAICDHTYCDVVQMGAETKHDVAEVIHALVVPFIYDLLTAEPVDHSNKFHDHLSGLELANSADASYVLEVNVLIGSNCYWNLVSGRVIKGYNRPTAIHTKIRWVLLGPVDHPQVTTNVTFITTRASD